MSAILATEVVADRRAHCDFDLAKPFEAMVAERCIEVVQIHYLEYGDTGAKLVPIPAPAPNDERKHEAGEPEIANPHERLAS